MGEYIPEMFSFSKSEMFIDENNIKKYGDVIKNKLNKKGKSFIYQSKKKIIL